MKKTMKRLSTLLAALVMMFSLSMSVFVAPGGTFTSQDIASQDTPHGHYFHIGKFYLNQWGNTPVSGTRVTTWEQTGDITQAWDVVVTTSGHRVVTTNQRRDLALNIYRSGSQPEVNVIAYLGNSYDDCALNFEKLRLATQTGTYANYGVTMTGENTSPYNAYGRICRWTASPTNWIHEA